MRPLGTIGDDGFSLGRLGLGLAPLSLRIGLRAYFTTYRSMRDSLHLCDPFNQHHDQKTADFNHSFAYWEAFAECILHLHHFFELLIKQILHNEHPLLALHTGSQDKLVYKLAMGQAVSDAEQEQVQWLEFGGAFKRLREIVPLAPDLAAGAAAPLVQSKELLDVLSRLRNRLTHRGRYILRSSALDELVGGHVLGLVGQLATLPAMKGAEDAWCYAPLTCGIKPIEEIAAEYRRSQPRFRRIAVLKELGRAAYNNPAPPALDGLDDLIGKEELRQRERWASSLRSMGIQGPRPCPVCGALTLMGYLADAGYDQYSEVIVSRIECVCCSFELLPDVGDPKALDLPLENLWEVDSWEWYSDRRRVPSLQ